MEAVVEENDCSSSSLIPVSASGYGVPGITGAAFGGSRALGALTSGTLGVLLPASAGAIGRAGSWCGSGGSGLGSTNGAAGRADLKDGRARVGVGAGKVVDRVPVAPGLRLIAP